MVLLPASKLILREQCRPDTTMKFYVRNSTARQCSRMAIRCSLHALGVRNPLRARFSAPLKADPAAVTTSCTNVTEVSFQGVKQPGCWVHHPPPNSEKNICAFMACYGLNFAPFIHRPIYETM